MGMIWEDFILKETKLSPIPDYPKILIYTGDESTLLWQKIEQFCGKEGMSPPFWAFAWPGGQALSRFVLDHPGLVRDKYVLDFACGCGIGAVSCMKAGASKVLACDVDPFAIAAAKLNAQANQTSFDTLCADLIGLDDGWDVILLGDLCYERDTAENVIKWLETLHLKGKKIYIGDPGRSYLPRNLLRQIACYDIRTTKDLEDSELKKTGIWEFL